MVFQMIQPFLELADAFHLKGNFGNPFKLLLNEPGVAGIIFNQENTDNFVIGCFHKNITVWAIRQCSTKSCPSIERLAEIGRDRPVSRYSSLHEDDKPERYLHLPVTSSKPLRESAATPGLV